jgi:hypothetical protein
MKQVSVFAVLCILFLYGNHSGIVQAQVVYQCGSTYSHMPCLNGKVVEATSPTTATQRAEARRVADRERQLAMDMKKDRLVEEAKLKPVGASSLSKIAATAVQPSSSAQRVRRNDKRKSMKRFDPKNFKATEPIQRMPRSR